MKLFEEKIIHPLLMQTLQSFYPSLCTIYDITTTQDAVNQPIETLVENPQLKAISCFIQPSSGAETRQSNQIVELNQWIVGLNGYYPAIVQNQAAVIDNVTYNIVRVAHDDLESATYLTVEKVS